MMVDVDKDQNSKIETRSITTTSGWQTTQIINWQTPLVLIVLLWYNLFYLAIGFLMASGSSSSRFCP